jgi:hypothetical protein
LHGVGNGIIYPCHEQGIISEGCNISKIKEGDMITEAIKGEAVYAAAKDNKIRRLFVRETREYKTTVATSKSKDAQTFVYKNSDLYKSPFSISEQKSEKHRKSIEKSKKTIAWNEKKIWGLEFAAVQAAEKKSQNRIMFRVKPIKDSGYTWIKLIDALHPKELFTEFGVNEKENKAKGEISLNTRFFGVDQTLIIYVIYKDKPYVYIADHAGNIYTVEEQGE